MVMAVSPWLSIVSFGHTRSGWQRHRLTGVTLGLDPGMSFKVRRSLLRQVLHRAARLLGSSHHVARWANLHRHHRSLNDCAC